MSTVVDRPTDMAELQLIDVRKVSELTGLHRTTINRQVRDGRFPRPVQLTTSRIAWRLADVRKWLEGGGIRSFSSQGAERAN